MKLILGVLLYFMLGVCSTAGASEELYDTGMCVISYQNFDDCQFNRTNVSLLTKNLPGGKKQLLALTVQRGENTYKLPISNNTSIAKGDKGYILFEDINFDKVPDIAITTTFGTANPYLDYWVYDPTNSKYDFIGNHARFRVDKKYKWLINIVKIRDDKYTNNIYEWRAGKLHKIPH